VSVGISLFIAPYLMSEKGKTMQSIYSIRYSVGSTDSDGVPIKWELAPVLNLMVYGEVPWRLEAL